MVYFAITIIFLFIYVSALYCMHNIIIVGPTIFIPIHIREHVECTLTQNIPQNDYTQTVFPLGYNVYMMLNIFIFCVEMYTFFLFLFLLYLSYPFKICTVFIHMCNRTWYMPFPPKYTMSMRQGAIF